MKHIGLSHRVDYIESYGERRDSLDQQWYKLLLAMGYLPVPLPNISKEYVDQVVAKLRLDGVIFTGGNSLTFIDETASDIAPERDEFEAELIGNLFSKGIPIVGVCRGMQVINSYFGGSCNRVSGHVAETHEIKNLSDSIKLPKVVNSFHSWGLTENDLAPNLQPLAKDFDDNIEAFINNNETVLGIMWHPERESIFNQQDINLIKRILK